MRGARVVFLDDLSRDRVNDVYQPALGSKEGLCRRRIEIS